MVAPDNRPSPEDFESRMRDMNSAPEDGELEDIFAAEENDAFDSLLDVQTENEPFDAVADAAEATAAAQTPAPKKKNGSASAGKNGKKKSTGKAKKSGASSKKEKVSFFTKLWRFVRVIIATVLIFCVAVIGAIIIVTRGPSEDARRIFVLSTNETSALKFVPNLFLPKDTVQSILHPEQVTEEPHSFTELPVEGQIIEDVIPGEHELVHISEETVTDELELLDVKGNTFKGKMLIIHDPTRVKMASIKDFGIDFGNYGIYLTEMIDRSGAVAGTNAGGFYDPNGQGNGGTPDGIVIRGGQLAFGSPYSMYVDVIGFDSDHVLHVGDMTGQEALDCGIVEGISFAAGPVLIQDGEKRTGLGGGVNPRTAIGQRSDGAVLLVVIEGRHPDSLGATYDDLANLMESYGAVNAANLDGGSSSTMIYNGQQITKGSTIVGSRPICTSILVLP